MLSRRRFLEVLGLAAPAAVVVAGSARAATPPAPAPEPSEAPCACSMRGTYTYLAPDGRGRCVRCDGLSGSGAAFLAAAAPENSPTPFVRLDPVGSPDPADDVERVRAARLFKRTFGVEMERDAQTMIFGVGPDGDSIAEIQRGIDEATNRGGRR